MPPPQPPKKSNALLFVLGGCAVLFLLGLVGVGIAGFIFYKKGSEIVKNPPRTTRTTTTTTPSTGDSDSNGSRNTSKSGDSVSGAPSWVVVYPGATTQNAFSSTSDDRKSGGFTLKTDDSADKVLDFYEDHMKEEGFNITKSSSSSYRAVVGLSKDYSQTFTVSVSELGGRQTIVVAYSYKQ